jgi:hypothetical protein
MNVRTLEATHLGPIEHADVRFGDLTVFVGPQATGKSILLQFLKLLVDAGPILAELKRQGLDWDKHLGTFLDTYLGEGMSNIWTPRKSKLKCNEQSVDLSKLIGRQQKNTEESLFFIPAQRVLTLSRGWPRTFSDYSPGDPFVVRDFSEKTRRLLETSSTPAEPFFPWTRQLRPLLRDLLVETVFGSFELNVDRHGAQKRLVLNSSKKGTSLPFMVWSAGQREFVPLLLGFYFLLPPAKVSRRGSIQWVVIEELEMGLHPRAISTVLLLVLELLSRDYRVCLATHSPHVLDLVWALRVFQSNGTWPDKLLELFDIQPTSTMSSWARKVLEKEARVYYFDPDSHCTKEISDLDPGAGDAAIAGWGGLTEFSGRAVDVVADVVNASTR